MANPTKTNLVGFGAYRFNPISKELHKEGMRVRLEGQPLAILQILLDRPGELVTREELQRNLWPEDTFVDFEHSLNAAIRRLRSTLNDSADQPRYIETLARRGYRFVAPVNGFVKEHESDKAVLVSCESQARARFSFRDRRSWLLAAAAVCLVGIALWGWRQSRNRQPTSAVSAVRSLAVLPLENLSGDPSQEYFADGMTEEIIGRLSMIHDLRVISRTSVMHLKNTQFSVPEIAKALGVDAIIEGSVMREGSRIRVHAQLIRGATDEHIWAKSYDRELGETLGLEGEVSQAIAHEVGIKLTPQMQYRLEQKQTTNSEAHDAYLRARYFYDKNDKEGALKCLQYLHEAIAKAPNYAAAYALLPPCYDFAGFLGLVPPDEEASNIKAASMKAVELDDQLAEAHNVLADYYLEDLWDFGSAEREYKRALELDPNSSAVHHGYSDYLRLTGTVDGGVQEIRRARELDPLSLSTADKFGWTLLSARRYDEALHQFRSILEMNPNYRQSRWGLARTYELKGMYNEAIEECHKIPALPNIDSFTKARFERRCSLYERVYTKFGPAGINGKWFHSARQEIMDAINQSHDAYYVATLYAATGEQGKALDLLERAFHQHDVYVLQLKVDPRLDNLRSNPRFQALLRRMNFPA
jgi:TolB-like protein/DNA-binding winged helix-turn-helix (wHTH) protein